MKKYIWYSFGFLIAGLCMGVFYREFSKYMGQANQYATLGLVHTHLLVLGCIMFLVIGLVVKSLEGRYHKKLFDISLIGYAVGVGTSALMLTVRGIVQILENAEKMTVSNGLNQAIAGITGLCHVILGVFIVCIFISFLLGYKKNKSEKISNK